MPTPEETQKNTVNAVSNLMAGTTLPNTEEGPSAAGVKSAVRWREQCLLARHLDSICGNRKADQTSVGRAKPWHYVTSFTNQSEGTPTADFLNKLHLSEGDKDFVNINTFERNNLLWSLEISKILYEEKKQTVGGIDTKDYSFKAEIPLVFEKMAAEDMSAYNAGESPTHGACDGEGLQYGGLFGGDGGQLNRPQTGYGIKSFSWSLIGSNPETVRNDIEAVLVLEFQNFEQLSRCRLDEASGAKYSLLDLLGYGPNSPKKVEGSEDDYNPAFYEIKAHVKWNANDYTRDSEKISLKNKVKSQQTTLFLTMTEHDFSISQIGTFTLTLSYRARLESLASEMRTNVVFPEMSDKLANIKAIKTLDQQLEQAASKGCIGDEYDKLSKERDKAFKLAWHESFKYLLKEEFKGSARTGLNKDGTKSRWSQDYALVEKRRILKNLNIFSKNSGDLRIHTLFLERKEIGKWLNGNREAFASGVSISSEWTVNDDTAAKASEELTSAIDWSQANQGDEESRVSSFSQRAINSMTNLPGGAPPNMTNDSHYPIQFVYLGELLDIMAHRAFSDANFSTTGTRKGDFGSGRKIKVISGPVKLKLKGVTKKILCSLSDIPISIEAFSDFWYRNVIESEREVYSFMNFVRDLSAQLISPAFGANCATAVGSGIEGMTNVKTAFITLPQHFDGSDPLLNIPWDSKKKAYHTVTGDVVVENMGIISDPEKLKNTSPENLFHYIVLYLDNSHGADGLTGIEDDDAPRGIYHLKIHQGILQSIDFSKTDQPYLRESRFFIHNKNPLVHLSNVYNVRASMVGNTCFYPGDTVFINPIGFGPSLGDPMTKTSLSSVMGLGGYHTIISVSNKVSKDFTTDIVAQWTSNGNAEARSSADIDQPGCSDKTGVASLDAAK